MTAFSCASGFAINSSQSRGGSRQYIAFLSAETGRPQATTDRWTAYSLIVGTICILGFAFDIYEGTIMPLATPIFNQGVGHRHWEQKLHHQLRASMTRDATSDPIAMPWGFGFALDPIAEHNWNDVLLHRNGGGRL